MAQSSLAVISCHRTMLLQLCHCDGQPTYLDFDEQAGAVNLQHAEARVTYMSYSPTLLIGRPCMHQLG